MTNLAVHLVLYDDDDSEVEESPQDEPQVVETAPDEAAQDDSENIIRRVRYHS